MDWGDRGDRFCSKTNISSPSKLGWTPNPTNERKSQLIYERTGCLPHADARREEIRKEGMRNVEFITRMMIILGRPLAMIVLSSYFFKHYFQVFLLVR